MPFFYWHHCCYHIPIDELCAWWRGHRSFVDPSVASIKMVDQFSIINLWNNRIYVLVRSRRLRKLIPFHIIEESIDDFDLIGGYTIVVVFSIEDNSKSGRYHSTFDFWRVVDCMHFEIISFAVNGVFRSSVEMKLDGLELLASSKGLLRKHGGKVGCIRRHLDRSMLVIFHFGIHNVLIVLDVSISFYLFKFTVRKINWTLVFCPAKILCIAT